MKVEEITLDLANSMDWICRGCFPNAMIMQGREQKTEYKPFVHTNGDTKKQLLARGRYLLFKPSGRWTESQAKRAKILFEKFPEIEKAYELMMYFRGIFEKIDLREKGKEKLDKWYGKIENSSIPELISVANTIKANKGKMKTSNKYRTDTR